MLTSTLGVRLLLLLGKHIPLPASYAVTQALLRIDIINDAEQGDGFQMSFALSKGKLGEYDLLSDGALEPFARVTVAVLLGTMPEVLINGVITHRQFVPSEEPGKSTLTVTGRDVGVMMDLEDRIRKYDNQPDSVIATQILLRYATYGLSPVVAPTLDIPLMVQRTPCQHATDLNFLKAMARRNSYVFYVEPLQLGISKAYFGPRTRIGVPQSALTLNMGGASNVSSIQFTQDDLAPVRSSGVMLDLTTQLQIPLPPQPPRHIPPLALRPIMARRTKILDDVAKKNLTQNTLDAQATAESAPEPVSAEGELETVRYGHILRARRTVGVRGTGRQHDGFYYVRRIKHSIERSRYVQRFTLSREGSGALLPGVVP